MKYQPVKLLDAQTAKKIAAGEVIERPASVVRELLDNSIDAEATRITLDIFEGGIKSICVIDNGFGMSENDLALCTKTHSTGKIRKIDDLLHVNCLGFRGEALASIKAVSDLEIITTQSGPLAYKYFNDKISKTSLSEGTKISVKNLFANFPARKKFLKLPAAESRMCRQVFVDKALANPSIEMVYQNAGKIQLQLHPAENFKDRALDALNIKEPSECFAEIYSTGSNFKLAMVLGIPDIAKSTRRNMYIFVNGRRIDEYGFIQAMDYGAEPFFPNGTHPVALAFLTVSPDAIDFNIHPAKKEAKFLSYREIHRVISSAVSQFYKKYTVKTMKKNFAVEHSENSFYDLDFNAEEMAPKSHFENFENRSTYERSIYNSLKNNPEIPVDSFSNNSSATNLSTNPSNVFSVSDASVIYQRKALDGRLQRPIDLPAPSFKFLGQVLGTFIVVEKNNNLYFIDQHAAQERIIFNRLQKNLKQKQELLVPYRIEAESTEEIHDLENASEQLKNSGFELERISESVWIVSSVPALWCGTEAELAKDIKKASSKDTDSDFLREFLALSACRAACKDGDILSPEAAFNLAKQTFELPEPLCPHGRPLWITITREELFKRIKRS